MKSQIKNNNLFIEILKQENIGKQLLKFLSIDDEKNILILSRKTYELMTNQYFLHYKFLFRKYKDRFLFEQKYKNNINNLYKIKEILEESDKLFKNLYKKSKQMIIIFYFSFLILGIDLFFISLILGKNNSTKKISWYSQISYIFLWIESFIIIIIYLFKMRKVKLKITEKIKINLPILRNDELNNLKKKINFRINNLKPLTFWYIAICFLIFYFPVLIKILFEKLDTSYEKAYIAIAWFMFLFFLLFDFVKLIYRYIYNWKTKIRKYKEIYNNGKSELYNQKIKEFKKNSNKTNCNEYLLSLIHFIIKCFIFAIILSYLKNLGRKFDNINYHVKWKSLFIPIYVINGFIFIWGILYIYSIRKYQNKNKFILNITLIIIIIGASIIAITVPQILDNNWNINVFIPCIGCFLLTIAIFIHFYIIKNIWKENKNNCVPRHLEVV